MADIASYKPEKYSSEQVRRIFGKGSSSLDAHMLSKRDPAAYADLKVLAVYRDQILGEDSLKPAQRLTREQLNEHFLKEKAAADNALIDLGDTLSARFGLPKGSKVDWATFKNLKAAH